MQTLPHLQTVSRWREQPYNDMSNVQEWYWRGGRGERIQKNVVMVAYDQDSYDNTVPIESKIPIDRIIRSISWSDLSVLHRYS